MGDSLRDQLLGLGLTGSKTQNRDKQTRPAGTPARHSKQAHRKHAHTKRPSDGIDLGKAYAIRAQTEKQERLQAERTKQEQARLRRDARARLAGLLQDKSLNDPAADIARHFDYGGKIKRIHVTDAQLKALNAGELGVVQLNGRYLLVDAATLAQVDAIFSAAIALKVDPAATGTGIDETYADPQFRIPDDLIW